MSVDDGIRRFWAWWNDARHRIVHAIEVDRHFSDQLVDEISRHVDAIGDLDWELAPGKQAKHAFCLSPKGESEARIVTELWRHRGPSPDATWEYFAARQASPNTMIVVDDVELDRDELLASFEVDTTRERIDAAYFHPRFKKLSEGSQLTALYLLLDGAFGEDEVERWLGSIEATPKKPKDAMPFRKLVDAVTELERNATGEKFVVMQGKNGAGEPLFVTCNAALKRIDHPLYTMHVAIELALLDTNPQGLTTQGEADRLNQLEDELGAALSGLGVYFGRETLPGRRVMHWYAPEDSAAQAIIDRWSKQYAARHPQIQWIHDPTWVFLKHYV